MTQMTENPIDYYNYFDRTIFASKDKEENETEYDFEVVLGKNVFENIENIVLGSSISVLLAYILVSIYFSKDFRVLYKTFRSNPRLNFFIVYDCLLLQNPVIRVLGITFRKQYKRKLTKDFYEKVLKRFKRREKTIMEGKAKQIVKDRFKLKLLRLQRRYSTTIDVPLYDPKELYGLEKKFEHIKKIKNMPKTCVLATNELDSDSHSENDSKVKSLIGRMQEINKTMIITGKT